MAIVRPFRPLRYDASVAGALADLVAPPYDVIDASQRAGLLAASPHNAVRLILPEVEYDAVAGLIAGWLAAGALTRDPAPLMIGWTQTFRLADGVERERRTVLATVGLEPYEARVVRPHERTHAGPKEDRLRLTRAVRTNLSPVFGLYPDPGGEVWAAAGVHGAPAAELTDLDGTVHRVWMLADPHRCAAVGAAMAQRWILIADGHHRYETALAYGAERDGDGPWRRVMMGLTALDDPGLVVLPTHRILHEWPADDLLVGERRPVADLPELLAALATTPADVPIVGVLRAGQAFLLTLPIAPDASPAAALDVAALEREVLVPRFGADQAALAARGTLTYGKDAADCARRVADGSAAGVFVMRSMPKASVAAVAEAGETMPQKSTYFFPKLLTGIAFNPLDDE